MKRVFADTSFYQALLNRRDRWHEEAARVFTRLDAAIVVTDYVLLELGALMSRNEARPLFVSFVQTLRNDESVEIVSASPALLDAGLALFASRPDKAWSLTDCISFTVMERFSIDEALSTDHHFEQAGFRSLLTK